MMVKGTDLSIQFLSTLSLRRATHANRYYVGLHLEFLSTLSLRRATLLYAMGYYRYGNFYPRSPCGERRRRSVKLFRQNYNFYPRSPCGERPSTGRAAKATTLFLSTLSLRRATGDIDLTEFNRAVFLSTLSLRRATH